MANVLIVDDERDLAQLLDFNLRQAGFETRQALSGEEGLRLANERVPDLILLDLMLPDLSGTEVCRRLKGAAPTRNVPVVMLTARGEELDRINGFEVGADDYVVKPFSIRELVLRVRAVLRRTSDGTETGPALTAGVLNLDPTSHRCSVAGEEVALTVLEFRLLQYLMKRPGRVHSRDLLLEEVWGLTSALETRTIDTHVMRLREKLGPARQYVETVRGVGYRLNLPEDGA
ncbi:MAG: response regulator [Myxococcaceae bacterium]